jgi:hypothetical protein
LSLYVEVRILSRKELDIQQSFRAEKIEIHHLNIQNSKKAMILEQRQSKYRQSLSKL